MSETLAEHLAKARAARSAEGLRRGVDKINAQRELLPCNCGRTDGTHSCKCRIYIREARRKSRSKAPAE